MSIPRWLWLVALLLVLGALGWSLWHWSPATLKLLPRALKWMGVAVLVVIGLFNLGYGGYVLRRKSHVLRLRSRDAATRIKAAEWLVRGGYDETIDDISAAIQRESDQKVRTVLVQALAAMACRYSVKRKEAIARRTGAPLTVAGPSEEEIIDKYILPPLQAALRSQDATERETASLTLFWLGMTLGRLAGSDSSFEIAPPEVLSQEPRDVQFTAFYPAALIAGRTYDAHVYAYTNEKLRHVFEGVLRERNAFGLDGPRSTTSHQTVKLAWNPPITVVGEGNGVEFTPRSATQRWNGTAVKFVFSFVVGDPGSLQEIAIRFSIRILSVEVAHLSFAVPVTRSVPTVGDMNPLARAKLSSATAVPYQKIFVSYSRKDRAVVRMYRRVQRAVGNEVFVDTDCVRAGEDWRAALARAIDTADIFQLFWSKNAATSPAVTAEWQYALKFRHPETHCVGFIRPVYWRKPLFPVPVPLEHLNFVYVPLDAAERKRVSR